MNTPCEENPEMWVGESVPQRREAAAICQTCPAREKCLAKAIENGETHGVWGGRDFSKKNALHRPARTDPTVCRRRGCDEPVQQNPTGARRLYCSTTCADRSRRKPIEHGTNYGYRAHLRRSEDACDECRAAHVNYVRTQRARKAAS